MFLMYENVYLKILWRYIRYVTSFFKLYTIRNKKVIGVFYFKENFSQLE